MLRDSSQARGCSHFTSTGPEHADALIASRSRIFSHSVLFLILCQLDTRSYLRYLSVSAGNLGLENVNVWKSFLNIESELQGSTNNMLFSIAQLLVEELEL